MSIELEKRGGRVKREEGKGGLRGIDKGERGKEKGEMDIRRRKEG